jgi:cytoskeletal protein CcmA (bactofilin family)
MEESQRQDADQPDEMSVIGAGIAVTGNIEASDDLHLLGKVNGDVRCATLILGEGSLIRGSVYAERVRAAGSIEGSLETTDLVVEASARLNGDITYSRIRIANGAIVDGRMIHRPSPDEGEGDTGKLRLVEPPAGSAKPQDPIYIE